jgi:hypothetical protein
MSKTLGVFVTVVSVCGCGSVRAADIFWLVAGGGLVALPSTGFTTGSGFEKVETAGCGEVLIADTEPAVERV